MSDLMLIITWLSGIFIKISVIIADHLILRIAVGLSIIAVILYTVLMVNQKNSDKGG